MSHRFVILHHRLADGEHWDLMLERGEVLATWRLPLEPRDATCLPMTVHRIGDHRKAYLDYEGPVSRNRGYVTRVDQGEWTPVEERSDCFAFDLNGAQLHGSFEIRREGDRLILSVRL
jgi:hypothetical protein